jgi:hypothetical protein
MTLEEKNICAESGEARLWLLKGRKAAKELTFLPRLTHSTL